ncbi:hypothetical protein [Sphingomonas sp.]|uniref:hypothetical protein n=1 Tax=Sphingomonas sp. TaxID=28214 RepID=UPI0025CC7DA2|nr:hypothetical protein [Sphingomonas sp.]
MSYDNRVGELTVLCDEVLEQVVREAETLIAAQLVVAGAADQRAMTFAGFLIAAATAAIGGVVALILSDKPDWSVVTIGTSYSLLMVVASGCAIWSAKPGPFSFPGNEPSCWHPDQWHAGASGPHDLHQARVEQAVTLQSQLGKNKRSLAKNSRWMRVAMALAFLATLAGAVAVGWWGVHRRQTPSATRSDRPGAATGPHNQECAFIPDRKSASGKASNDHYAAPPGTPIASRMAHMGRKKPMARRQGAESSRCTEAPVLSEITMR